MGRGIKVRNLRWALGRSWLLTLFLISGLTGCISSAEPTPIPTPTTIPFSVTRECLRQVSCQDTPQWRCEVSGWPAGKACPVDLPTAGRSGVASCSAFSLRGNHTRAYGITEEDGQQWLYAHVESWGGRGICGWTERNVMRLSFATADGRWQALGDLDCPNDIPQDSCPLANPQFHCQSDQERGRVTAFCTTSGSPLVYRYVSSDPAPTATPPP